MFTVKKWKNKGAGNRPSFLVYELVKANSGGPWTDVLARIPARKTPYAKFLLLLAAPYGATKSRNSAPSICFYMSLPAANDRPTQYPARSPSYAIFSLLLAADHMRYILLKVGPDRFPIWRCFRAKADNYIRTKFI